MEVAEINITEPKIHYLIGATKLDYQGVMFLVDDIMTKTLEYTITDIEEWISIYVAKRTGQLQDSLIRFLKTSAWVNNKLKLILGTDLEYAQYVNNMSSNQVRHSGEIGKAYYYGFFGDVLLDDPMAQGGFWGLLRMEGKRSLKDNFARVRMEICGGLGISARPIATIRVK
jgi:hypothetical protein